MCEVDESVGFVGGIEGNVIAMAKYKRGSRSGATITLAVRHISTSSISEDKLQHYLL
ncbi:uncharacterized protein G2W53_030338 [Senna tora]|uniref:Uncharacterized protein n=1 Tax=Senna tora TaxID=362788 RepID=A0A834T641_9FABA|nr:uncharacterized protein G2W53_030338 [Senna tora]